MVSRTTLWRRKKGVKPRASNRLCGDLVKGAKLFAWSIVTKRWKFLLANSREDVAQEISILCPSIEGEDILEAARIVDRTIYRLARNLGWRKVKGKGWQKEKEMPRWLQKFVN